MSVVHKRQIDSLLNVERQHKKIGFNWFLKTLVSEMVRNSSSLMHWIAVLHHCLTLCKPYTCCIVSTASITTRVYELRSANTTKNLLFGSEL